MAYQYESDEGHAKIGGEPADAEKAHGGAAERRSQGRALEWDPSWETEDEDK